MIKNWIFYLLSLAATLVFHACYFEWFSWFFLLLMLGLPGFSLLVSLIAMVKVRIGLEVPPSCTRGEPAYVTIQARGSFLPMPQCRFRLRVEQVMTGSLSYVKEEAPGTDSWYEPLDTAHCGLLRCQAEKVRVYDYLGLFWLPMPKSEVVELAVEPAAVPPARLPNLSHFLARRRRPKPGGGFSEEHELRDYRPGDSLRDIHWKLSVKTDRMIVREAQEPVKEQTLLTFDLTGTPEQVDSTLEQLSWLSRWLLDHDTAHEIRWIDPTNCEMAQASIRAPEELEQLLRQLLHAVLRPDTPSMAERHFARVTWRYHIQPEQEAVS